MMPPVASSPSLTVLLSPFQNDKQAIVSDSYMTINFSVLDDTSSHQVLVLSNKRIACLQLERTWYDIIFYDIQIYAEIYELYISKWDLTFSVTMLSLTPTIFAISLKGKTEMFNGSTWLFVTHMWWTVLAAGIRSTGQCHSFLVPYAKGYPWYIYFSSQFEKSAHSTTIPSSTAACEKKKQFRRFKEATN